MVGAGVRVGSNCNLGHGVTLGVGGRGQFRGSPVLGNRVYLAPGCKVFGPIVIGSDVVVGANAVVVEDIPDHAVVSGGRATVIATTGTAGLVDNYVDELD